MRVVSQKLRKHKSKAAGRLVGLLEEQSGGEHKLQSPSQTEWCEEVTAGATPSGLRNNPVRLVGRSAGQAFIFMFQRGET